MADYTNVLSDRSWNDPNRTPEENLTELSKRLEAEGYKPGTSEFDSYFYSIVNLVSSSTNSSLIGDPYASSTGNLALKNWMAENFTQEMASKIGVDVAAMTGWSPDSGGYYNSAGEFVKPDDPYQRNSDGTLTLVDGQPIRADVYAVREFYKGVYGRLPTEEEIADGIAGLNTPQGYRRMFINTYGREPTPEEIAAGIDTSKPGVSGMDYGTGFSSTGKINTGNKLTTPIKTWEQEQAELAEKRRTENAISVLTDLFTQYGLQSLIPKMKELAIKGASDATITLELSQTEEWKTRFKANEERRKKGLAVLQPGEYIGLEDKYRQILRAYGLKRFDSDDYVSQFLSNDISPTELNSRVQLASQRIEAADPLVTSTLRRFYNITNTDLVAYMLNPDEELPKLERQVTAAEIGAKMLGQGIAANLTGKTFTGAEGGAFSNVQRGTIGVEAMMQAGATAEEAARVSKYIASVLPRAEFLSSIYGPSGYQQYGQLQAEQEGFQGLASAERARQQLVGREFAEFRGSSGISKAAFGSQSQGQF